MTTSTAACLWFTEVAGVAVCSKDHVTGVVCDDGFFLHGEIIKELYCVFHVVLCRFGRLGGNGADGAQDGRVYGPTQKKEFSANLLDEFFCLFLSNRGALDLEMAYCFLAPYLMGFMGNGACCGSGGRLCWKSLRAFAT